MMIPLHPPQKLMVVRELHLSGQSQSHPQGHERKHTLPPPTPLQHLLLGNPLTRPLEVRNTPKTHKGQDMQQPLLLLARAHRCPVPQDHGLSTPGEECSRLEVLVSHPWLLTFWAWLIILRTTSLM